MLKHYQNTKPIANIKEFFQGKIEGYGLIQNRKGLVVTRFDVKMNGKWKGNNGILEEEFKYYNGKTQNRTWHIKKLKNGKYEGSASDIIGIAKGEELGTAINWHYSMYIDVKNNRLKFKLDDWMWQMNDGIMINRSYIKKFGIRLAELTLFMRKC